MRNTLFFLFSLLICCGTLQVQAQNSETNGYSVTGTLIDDETQKPVSYATAILFEGESEQAHTAVVAEENGKFTLKAKAAGSYTLEARFVGYTSVKQEVTLTDENPEVDLGKLLMTAGIMADKVTVTASVPLVTTDIDKISYNTEADPETPSLTAMEMLRKVPLLTVDGEENIELKGQRNFKILVNGKTSTLMAQNYKDVLKAMPASSIKSIEVITDPPSKYDAEGVAGIINIITHRKPVGFNGSIGANADSRGGFGGNAYIAAALGKFNVSGSYYGGKWKQPSGKSYNMRENLSSDEARFMETRGDHKYHGMYHGLSLEASYEIDTFNLITLSGSGHLGNWENEATDLTEINASDGSLTSAYRNIYKNKSKFGSLSGTLDYQRTFMKPDKTFTASYKIQYTPNDSEFDRTIEEISNYPGYGLRSKNDASGYEHTLQADYFNPINENHQVEAGAKYILRPNDSETKEHRLDPGSSVWVPDNSQKNDLDYDQHIIAGYTSYQYKLKKVSFKGGVRAEYTINDGTFMLADGDHKLDNDYFDLIPSLTIGYQPKQGQNLRVGYTQRLSRPGIWHLNPYVNDRDPYNISTGNPSLKSEVSHTINMSYGKYTPGFNINFSVSGTQTNNSIENIGYAQPDGVMLNTYDNIGRRKSVNFGLYTMKKMLNNKLTVSLNSNANYIHINSNNGTGQKRSGWRGNGNLSVNAQPWKNGNIYLGGGFYTAWIGLQQKGSNGYYHYASISHGFLDRKLNVYLSANSPFRGKRTYSYTSLGPDFIAYGEQEQKLRSFRLSINWRFGKTQTQVKKTKRGIQNDDMKSGGGEGGQGGSGGGGGQ